MMKEKEQRLRSPDMALVYASILPFLPRVSSE